MHDGTALLKAIIQKPEEDTPRLAYADWLENDKESGQFYDPVHAEFIRLQIQLERGKPEGAEYVKLKQREMELLQEHGANWAPPELKALGVTLPEFRRGFVEKVQMSCDNFTLDQRGAKIFEHAPIKEVRVTGIGTEEQGALLALCPWLERLTGLGLHIADLALGHVILNTLRSTHAQHITALNITGCNLPGLAYIPEAMQPRLTTLNAAHNQINPDAVIPFLNHAPSEIESLDLRASRAQWVLVDGTIPGITETPGFRRLKHLGMSDDTYGATLRNILASTQGALTSLDIEVRSPETLERIARSPLPLQKIQLNIQEHGARKFRDFAPALKEAAEHYPQAAFTLVNLNQSDPVMRELTHHKAALRNKDSIYTLILTGAELAQALEAAIAKLPKHLPPPPPPGGGQSP